MEKKTDPIAEISARLRGLTPKIRRAEGALLPLYVAAGVAILAGRRAHLVAAAERRDESTGRLVTAAGFEAWIAEIGIAKATAHRWGNAAANAFAAAAFAAGCTTRETALEWIAQRTEADIAALDLEGATLADFTAPFALPSPDAPDAAAEPDPQPVAQPRESRRAMAMDAWGAVSRQMLTAAKEYKALLLWLPPTPPEDDPAAPSLATLEAQIAELAAWVRDAKAKAAARKK